MGINNININSNEWKQTQKLFINENGVSEHTTMFGLLLKNSNESDICSNVIIENLYIHDLILNPKQVTEIGISNDL